MSRRHHTDKEKSRIIREFQNHHGSTTDFCRIHGISSQTFANWRRRPEVSLASKPDTSEFFEFEIGAKPDRLPASSPLVELELGAGMILRIFPARI
jgi:transposase-like protein